MSSSQAQEAFFSRVFAFKKIIKLRILVCDFFLKAKTRLKICSLRLWWAHKPILFAYDLKILLYHKPQFKFDMIIRDEKKSTLELILWAKIYNSCHKMKSDSFRFILRIQYYFYTMWKHFFHEKVKIDISHCIQI